MKRLIHTPSNTTTWRGERYEVDGAPGVVDDPDLVLATEVRHDPPEHDPATQRLVRIEDGIENETEWHMRRFAVVDLSREEIDERAARTAEQAQQAQQEQQVRNAARDVRDGTGTERERLRRLELVVDLLIGRTLGP